MFISLLSLTAQTVLSKASEIGYDDRSKDLLPSYARFDANQAPSFTPSQAFINDALGLPPTAESKLIRQEEDDLGFIHYRYQQMVKEVPIEGAIYIYHVKNQKLMSMNGHWFTEAALTSFANKTRDKLSEAQALQAALNHINAKQYKWQLLEEEQQLKTETGDRQATYFPTGEKVYVSPYGSFNTEGVRLAYKFNVYAHFPISRRWVFIDVENGQVLMEDHQIHHANTNGTASTAYSGNRPIVCDSYNGQYRLRETTRGNGITTLNMRSGSSYSNSVDFISGSPNWSFGTSDIYGLDGHFGTEITYDYFKNVHNRNSIDGYGYALWSYVNANLVGMGQPSNDNAFWDGSKMTYGMGSSVRPLVCLDVVGHEITHGLTERTSGLVYSYESGALNESFSDIFGTVIEFYANAAPNWTMGEKTGLTFRSMANPNVYQDPDTYKGTYWVTGSADNGGVHTNSGVQNFWFYLLANGGNGTNDNGLRYSVQGIGIDKAAKIAFRNLTWYLGAYSNYSNARFYAIQSASDLYGANSNEVAQVTNAWCAVGVGTCALPNLPPTVSITAPANGAVFSAPATITINANAADADGTVTKVEFYNGSTKLGEDLTAPYSYTWANVAISTYSLTAVATDNRGATTTSTAVQIRVNNPPTITITAPINNAIFTPPAFINIAATATDVDGRIVKVEFFNGATKLGEDLIAPYTYSWSNVPAGTYSLTAKATDNDGATRTSTVVAVVVRANNQPPVVAITAPTNNSTFPAPATITINATASDPDGTVAKVEFFNGLTKLGEDLTAPYSFTWANVPAGNYILTAKATDNAGLTATSLAIAISVINNQLPSVSITSPVNGTVFAAPATIAINANASDPDGTITKVEFFNGATKLGEDLSAPYTFTWSNVAIGAYSLTAKATDNKGAVATSTAVAISVQANKPPTISITSPANGSTFTAPATFAFTVNATDVDGTVTKVEFFNNNVKLGEDLSAPYSWAISNLASGGYILTAKATDDKGATASAEIQIKVYTPVCNAPAIPSVSSVTSSSAFVSWAAVTGAISYKVEYKRSVDATWLSFNSVATSITLSNLQASTLYNVRVSTNCTTGTSLPSMIANFTTLSNIICYSPISLTISTITSTSASVSWAIPLGATSYKVEYKRAIDATWISLNSSTNTINLTNLQAGTLYGVRVTTICNTSNSQASPTVNFTTTSASNQAPTVAITSPVTESVFTAPANITITANASDPDGTITKVEFFYGGAKIGEDLTAPYAVTWANVAQNLYVLTAKATDNVGAVTTSSIVVVHIDHPSLNFTLNPKYGQVFTAPAQIPVSVTFKKTTNPIRLIEFWQNGVALRTLTAPPYSFTWSVSTVGTYYLTVHVADIGGIEVWREVKIIVTASGLGFIGNTETEEESGVLRTPPVANNQYGVSEYSKSSDLTALKMTLSPNPAQAKVNLQIVAEIEGDYELTIFNAVGQLVLRENFDVSKGENTEQLDVSALTKGLYMVCVNHNGLISTQKLIIK